MTADEIAEMVGRWRAEAFMFRVVMDLVNEGGPEVPKPLTILAAPFDRNPDGLMGVDLVYRHNGEVAVHLKLKAGETLDTVREVLAFAWPMAHIKFPSVLA